MANIILRGNKNHTSSDLPPVGKKASDFSLTASDLSTKTLKDFRGSRLILNVFPSIDTNTCAQSVRTFNEKATQLDNTKVLCISRDLPFAQNRFCANEGIENVVALSDYKTGDFGKTYGLNIVDGPFEALHSRCIIVIDENGTILHTEQVEVISDEPDYDKAISALDQ
ncbi:thiol peroxidase (atypical 2-Cys peroxiredoxin) [Flavobacteriaceae bacterium MAR_2010_188]|nr:thiol peroxidase (atypical 2-Cys peroxiredoxin) [Flavobacteriaceae bacterium MAR_2010_188]